MSVVEMVTAGSNLLTRSKGLGVMNQYRTVVPQVPVVTVGIRS